MKRRWLALVFVIAHVLGRIMALFDYRIERILVIRTDGVGDALLFEPAIRSLSRMNPFAKLHLWAPSLSCDLLRHCPAIARQMVIPRGFKAGNLEYLASIRWRWIIGYALGRWEFARVIYPARSPEPLGNWLFVSARAKQRWICDGDAINQFEQQRQATQARASRIIGKEAPQGHELVVNESMTREWDDPAALGLPMVHLTKELNSRAEAQLDAWRIEMNRLKGREIIGVVMGASMSINSYPREKWVLALSRLWKLRRALPVLLGGPEDQKRANEMANSLRASHVPCLRLFMDSGILDMAALIARLDGVLSVDTGLAHLAVAQHVPTVVLVGGGNPGRFFPWPQATHHVALNVATPCAGCNNRCTEPEPICITQIAPEEIVSAYVRLKIRSVSVQLYVAAPPVYQKAG